MNAKNAQTVIFYALNIKKQKNAINTAEMATIDDKIPFLGVKMRKTPLKMHFVNHSEAG